MRRCLFLSTLLVAGTVIVTVAIGCSGSSGGQAGSAEAAAEEPPGPSLSLPDEAAPEQLEINDLKEGKGRPAKVGDHVVVNYKGINWKGALYANSWTYRNRPEFELGTDQLERGFDLGIRGMREGGRRELRIPPQLSYRPGFKPSTRPDPDASLLFIVELLKLR